MATPQEDRKPKPTEAPAGAAASPATENPELAAMNANTNLFDTEQMRKVSFGPAGVVWVNTAFVTRSLARNTTLSHLSHVCIFHTVPQMRAVLPILCDGDYGVTKWVPVIDHDVFKRIMFKTPFKEYKKTAKDA